MFDAGTSAWVCAIDDQCAPGAGGPMARKAITAISTNLLRAMAIGRAGAAHPATGAGVPPGYGSGTAARRGSTPTDADAIGRRIRPVAG